jgi:hypothetical protein
MQPLMVGLVLLVIAIVFASVFVPLYLVNARKAPVSRASPASPSKAPPIATTAAPVGAAPQRTAPVGATPQRTAPVGAAPQRTAPVGGKAAAPQGTVATTVAHTMLPVHVPAQEQGPIGPEYHGPEVVTYQICHDDGTCEDTDAPPRAGYFGPND